jgi:group I intron endonuclease
MEYKVYILRTIDDTTPRYVGITTGKLNTRLVKHIHDIKREACKNIHKKNWLAKNKENIIIEQIDVTNDIQDLKEKEIFYINKFREEGINLLNATDGGDGNYGYKHSEEVLEKISGVNHHMYGKKHTKEWIENAKKQVPVNKGVKTGIPAWNNGIPCSEEAKEKQRVKKLGKKDSYETINKKSKSSKSYLRKRVIECLVNNDWVEYESAKDAASILGLHRTKIILVCNGKRNHTGGYKFRYKE